MKISAMVEVESVVKVLCDVCGSSASFLPDLTNYEVVKD
ncbi:hypothetical protein SAMN04515663_1048 [Alcanivorax sp. DSM 26293]|nr:hypothetical protein SAMN04515663_1048 [Alcanivorax sp. DSM 26293]